MNTRYLYAAGFSVAPVELYACAGLLRSDETALHDLARAASIREVPPLGHLGFAAAEHRRRQRTIRTQVWLAQRLGTVADLLRETATAYELADDRALVRFLPLRDGA